MGVRAGGGRSMTVSIPLSPGHTVELTVGNIRLQPDLDVVVTTVNSRPDFVSRSARLKMPGFPGGSSPSDPSLGTLDPGQAVMIAIHSTQSRFVILCLESLYRINPDWEKSLRTSFRNSMDLAEWQSLGSLGFPGTLSGGFSHPLASAAAIALETVADRLPRSPSLRVVRFVLSDSAHLSIFEKIAAGILRRRNAAIHETPTTPHPPCLTKI